MTEVICSDLEVVSNWVLFDAEADKPYIKKMLPEGFLAFFDCEEDARRAKANNPGTDHKRIDRVKAEDAQAIIDGLRGEVGAQRVKTCIALKERNDAREERDQHAQRIGELEGLLRSCLPALSDGGCAALANRIDAAISAICAAAPNIAPTSEHSSQPERTKVAELVELVRSKFPRIDPCQPVPLDEKAHCCEYTIYVERERLHRLIDAKLASLEVINLDYLPDDVGANAQNVRGYLIPSVDLTPLQLSLRYPDGHPVFTEKMWQDALDRRGTDTGYWSWVQLRVRDDR